MIADKFQDHTRPQPFSYKIVYVEPKELQDQHQQCNKEGGDKGSGKGPKDQLIEFRKQVVALMPWSVAKPMKQISNLVIPQ